MLRIFARRTGGSTGWGAAGGGGLLRNSMPAMMVNATAGMIRDRKRSAHVWLMSRLYECGLAFGCAVARLSGYLCRMAGDLGSYVLHATKK